jgi:hypothetical protein
MAQHVLCATQCQAIPAPPLFPKPTICPACNARYQNAFVRRKVCCADGLVSFSEPAATIPGTAGLASSELYARMLLDGSAAFEWFAETK